ncbi:MAG: T9SS type A sorting domain-containing protein [Calditrichaeota bacterium]|nr:T9SS type A sorting domain-containing protein [Calditrichota bacterium]
MKNILSIVLLMSALYDSRAQVADSVITGNKNVNDVYYSMLNGIVKTEPNTNWDLAFEVNASPYASIMINHANGVQVWNSTFAIADWSSFDTSAKSGWNSLYNNPYRWNNGALNRYTDGVFNVGWGVYNPSTHVVSGDSIFLIKLGDGSYKKLVITSLNVPNYTIKYADLDGSNEKTVSVSIDNYKDKNFAYYSMVNNMEIDREPDTKTWDMVFTKYIQYIHGANQHYLVSGVWINKARKSAEARNVSTSITDYSAFSFSDSASVIGYDWKTFDLSSNTYSVTDNLVYFVQLTDKTVYKLIFTGYSGSATGTYYFTKQALSPAQIKVLPEHLVSVYPNPVLTKTMVSVPDGSGLLSIDLIDLMGKRVYSGSKTEMDLSSLSSGTYFLQVRTDSGIYRSKLIKH